MKKVYRILVVFTILIVSGCEKLEEVPYDFIGVENIYQDEEDVDSALFGVYQPLLLDGVDDLWFWLTLSGPSENAVVRFKAAAQGRFSSVNFNETDPQLGIWISFYRGINRANLVIENVSKVGLDKTLEDQKIAEARFMRAFYYFNLGHIFGGVPLHLESSKSFDDESVKLPRSTLEEVYSLVEEDLKFAEVHLPDQWDASNSGRATVGAAKALLGKLYLTMAGKPLEQDGMYEMAVQKLEEVTGLYSLVPNYADVFNINNEFNSEIIFARPNITDVAGSGTVLTFFAGAPLTPFAWAGGQYQIGFSEEFYDSYTEGDARRDVTLLYSYTDITGFTRVFNSPDNPADGPSTETGGVPFGKLKDPGATLSPFAHGNDIVYMRYADVLLMLAEAYNESGDSPSSLLYLNQVRSRAGISNVTTTDQASLRDNIKQERKWELAGEYTEYYDLQRWGDIEESLSQNPDAIQLNVGYNPRVELYPIPLFELQANEFLEQNPGY